MTFNFILQLPPVLTVLSSESRSDSYISGRGSSTVYNGSGGGNTQISTKVVITRDIRVVTDEGKEVNWRYDIDIPVRQGQRLHSITPFRDNAEFNEMALYNTTTEKIWKFYKVDDLLVKNRFFML